MLHHLKEGQCREWDNENGKLTCIAGTVSCRSAKRSFEVSLPHVAVLLRTLRIYACCNSHRCIVEPGEEKRSETVRGKRDGHLVPVPIDFVEEAVGLSGAEWST